MIRNKTSKKFYFINYIFIFFTIWSLTEYVKFIPIVSGIWQARDIVNITSFILFFIYLQEIKRDNIKNLIIFTNILIILVFYLACFYKFIPYNINDKNILINNNISKNFKENFNDASNSEMFENKIYFGPDIINEIDIKKSFRNVGIFNTTDFTKLNLSPFQSDFKNISLDQIQKSQYKMRGLLKPKYTEINNEIFLSTFRIKYLLLSEIDFWN